METGSVSPPGWEATPFGFQKTSTKAAPWHWGIRLWIFISFPTLPMLFISFSRITKETVYKATNSIISFSWGMYCLSFCIIYWSFYIFLSSGAAFCVSLSFQIPCFLSPREFTKCQHVCACIKHNSGCIPSKGGRSLCGPTNSISFNYSWNIY